MNEQRTTDNRRQTTDNKQHPKNNRQPAAAVRVAYALLLVVVCLSFAAPRHASAYAFYRDLKAGDVGEDVRELQKTLNQRPETRLSNEGAGSPGQETAYFGERTRTAVVRYQELFATNILAPLGLFTGTGYVGVFTRRALSGAGAPIAAVPLPNPTPQPVIPEPVPIDETDFEGTPAVSSLSREESDGGVIITVHGRGFTKDGNEAHTNHGIYKNIDSTDGKTLSFTIEGASISSSAGVVDSGLFIENENGKSNLVLFVLGI